MLSSRDRQSPPGMKPVGSEVCALSFLPSTSKAHFKLHKIAEDTGDAENIPGGQVVPEGVVRCLRCAMIKNIKGTFMLQQMRSCMLASPSRGMGGIWRGQVVTLQDDRCRAVLCSNIRVTIHPLLAHDQYSLSLNIRYFQLFKGREFFKRWIYPQISSHWSLRRLQAPLRWLWLLRHVLQGIE